MRRQLATLSVVLLILSGWNPALSAGERPFKATYDFVGTDAVIIDDTHILFKGVLSGHATHLGRFVGETQYLVDVTTGMFETWVTLVAANGDQLSSRGMAVFTPIGGAPTGSIGTFEIHRGHRTVRPCQRQRHLRRGHHRRGDGHARSRRRHLLLGHPPRGPGQRELAYYSLREGLSPVRLHAWSPGDWPSGYPMAT